LTRMTSVGFFYCLCITCTFRIFCILYFIVSCCWRNKVYIYIADWTGVTLPYSATVARDKWKLATAEHCYSDQPSLTFRNEKETRYWILISTISCDCHYLIVCQHNSWTNFILKQHRKRTILFLQGSVETRNRCCGQYMHGFIGNLFRCKSAKNYKIQLRFHKAISI